MSYNLKALKRKHESASSLPRVQKTRENKFPWINPNFLKDGQTYLFRLLPPDPAKNPHGIHFYITYDLPLDQEGKSRAQFPSSSMFDKEPDPIVGLLESILDEEGDIIPDLKSHLSSDAIARLKEFAPKVTRLIPVLLQATIEKSGQYDAYFPSDDPDKQMGALFALRQQPTLDNLYESITNLLDPDEGGDPSLPDLEDGRWVAITRKKYDFRLVVKHGEDITGHKELDSYPSLAKYGEKKKKDRASIISLVESSWAYRELSKYAEIEL